ncbi:uncharacterized protein LOC112694054 [Sipha flava]|uniref:Uncharacterized protein LOC112694054 n=1 Tax=Sipha flava TaxID=143950 RepID=A0A8B8GQ85_9HEMI|nr:uncharacterized protein LOC112694054 [Sipha flava]
MTTLVVYRRKLRDASDVQRQHARFGRRFFGAADRVSTQYRRESLRTTRSLRTLMHGYLRESSDGSAALAANIGAGPAQVLDRLRVMQEQCARIAERVRRRSGCSGNADEPGDGSRAPCDGDTDRKGRQIDLLSDAQHRLTAGREFVRRTRALVDRAVADVHRENVTLRGLLCAACAACVGREAQLNGACTVVDVAARLEKACFALFARLDSAMGSDAASRQTSRGRPGTGQRARDVVTSCLGAVQAQRADTVRRAQDVEYRVNNFHKAVNRLLLAATPTVRVPRPANNVRHGRGPTAVRSRAAATVRGKTPAKKNPTPESTASAAVTADAGTVTMLCPPSIGIIEYE